MGAWLGRYQAWLFFPMLLLEGLHLHIASVRALLGRSGKARWAEAGLLTDLALGGLNYQIEHHLFPPMPRPSLRHAQARVRAFCAQHGIPYTQTGLLASYAQVLRILHTTGRTAGPDRLLTQPPQAQMRPLNRATHKTLAAPRLS